MIDVIASDQPDKLVGFIGRNSDKSFFIDFPHGLGDVIMFYPCYEALKSQFPDTRIDLKIRPHHEASGLSTFDPTFVYDYRVPLRFFHPNKDMRMTKTETCCVEELGIPQPTDRYKKLKNEYNSPFVALGFHSNCDPVTTGCPKNIAAEINKGVLDAGYIPLLLHFTSESDVYEPRNYKDLVLMSTKGAKVSLDNLFGALKHSFAYIGVVSGHMWSALSILGPERCFLLERCCGDSATILPKKDFKFTYQHAVTSKMITDWLNTLPVD